METKPKTELLEKVLSKQGLSVEELELYLNQDEDARQKIPNARILDIKEIIKAVITETETEVRASTLAEVRAIIEERRNQIEQILIDAPNKYPKVKMDSRARLAEFAYLLEKLSSLQKPSEKVSSKADDKKV